MSEQVKGVNGADRYQVNLKFDWRWVLSIVGSAVISWLAGRGVVLPSIFGPSPDTQPPFVSPQPQQPSPFIPPVIGTPIDPSAPLQPAPVESPVKKADAIGAVVKVYSGNSGCTGIHLGDIMKSGHSYWLTAAHCTRGIGSKITIVQSNGEKVTATVVSRDAGSDVSISRSPAKVDYPFASIATELPKAGDAVFFKGYGVRTPGKIEKGTVAIPDYMYGRSAYNLSFSSGDSGSSICREDNGEIVGVCHGYTKGRADGAHCLSIRKVVDRLSTTTEVGNRTPLRRVMQVVCRFRLFRCR